MKFTCDVTINVAISKVVGLWNDDQNLKMWQDGFVKKILISGQLNTVGAKSRIFLKQNKREMELLETITSINLPHEKSAIYEHIHMTNTLTNRFIKKNENLTQYISEVEYTKFNGIIPKLMAKFFPGVFKKQTQKWLDQFKNFAENNK